MKVVLSVVVIFAVYVAAEVPCICPFVGGDQTCGVDGKWYASQCDVECAGTVRFDGVGICPCPCTRILSPVCGSDGKWYDNDCLLTCAGVELAETADACPAR